MKQVLLLALLVQVALADFGIVNQRVEYLVNPLGVDTPQPRFSWEVVDTARGSSVNAYQIWVSNNPLVPSGDVWDSGKVVDDQFFLVPLSSAVTLKSDTKYFWKVVVYSPTTQAVSGVASFSTGLLQTSDWHGKWISGGDANNELRKEFQVTSPISSASAFISGIGYYEMYINGQKVGDRKLDVGWTDYGKRVYYTSFDITSYLTQGANAIAIMLGNGWYACAGGQPGCVNLPPQAFLQVNVKTAAGVVEVVSDETWKSSPGPITYNSLYNGEHYDARLETPGWDMPNYDDSKWQSVQIMHNAATGAILSSALFEPIRKIRPFAVLSMWEPTPGVFVVDFGQNTAGILSIKVRGQSGQVVKLRHAELLMHPPYGDVDGTIYVGNLRGAQATDVYTLKGDPAGEVYEPRFTQHGFRYAEISGLTYTPTEDDITMWEMHTDVSEIGNVVFSDKLLTKIQHMCQWGQKSNLMSVPTDCPQRDERRGWMGDASLTAEEASYNYAMGAMYTNWLNIIQDDQHADGSVTDFTPSLGTGAGAPNWQTAFPEIIRTMNIYYGDLDIVKRHWPALQKYIGYFDAAYKRTGIANFITGYGDWVPPPPAAKANAHLVGAFAYLQSLQMMRDFALSLGDSVAANDYNNSFNDRGAEFNSAFYDASRGCYGSGGATCLQTENAMGLWLGLAPSVNAVLNYTIHDILVTNNGHTTCGIIGWKLLLEALTRYGRTDVVLTMLQQTSYPSFGYMIYNKYEPATTVWELWDSDVEGPGMNSRNHIMFGTPSSWYYKYYAGILPATNGYRDITITPSAIGVNNVTSLSATVRSPRGPVAVEWSIAQNQTCLVAQENTVATLSCMGSTISKILFASFGTPQGSCTSGYTPGTCNAPTSMAVASKCVGQSTCAIYVNDTTFGDPCFQTVKVFAVSWLCSNGQSGVLTVDATVPPTATAVLTVPLAPWQQSSSTVTISEGGQTVWMNGRFVPGVSGIVGGKAVDGGVAFNVLSGNYVFSSM